MTGTLERADDILLVEDNPDDVDLTREAFRELGAVSRLHVVEDGVEAIAFLRHESKYADAPTPDLVLLDLNLPKKDGRAVLRDMKSDPRLRHIPVVVLSSSEADRDLIDAYQLQASCFVTKPPDLDAFFTAVQGIEQFWMVLAQLPPPAGPQSPPRTSER